MKITKQQLKQIIKEEISNVLSENEEAGLGALLYDFAEIYDGSYVSDLQRMDDPKGYLEKIAFDIQEKPSVELRHNNEILALVEEALMREKIELQQAHQIEAALNNYFDITHFSLPRDDPDFQQRKRDMGY